MPLTHLGRALLAALALLTIAAPAAAEGGDAPRGRYERHARGRMLPPEVRYRDPRYAPPRRARAYAPPPSGLIQAYLPRLTESPMYNEPPARFPQR